MSVPIQLRILIKGCAALPLSPWACLIFRPLGRAKREAIYKLERVLWLLDITQRHPERVEESEESLINFDCLHIWKFTFSSRKNVNVF